MSEGTVLLLTEQQLLFWVTIHVALLCISVGASYMFLLELWRRKTGEERGRLLFWYSAGGFIAALFAFVVNYLYLTDYYTGKLGFISEALLEHLPVFVLARNILLPVLVFILGALSYSILHAGRRNGASYAFKHIITAFGVCALITGIILVVLGTLTP